jgi:hypothetical protein
MKTYVRFCAHLERNSLHVCRNDEMFRAKVMGKLKHTFYDQYNVFVRRVAFDTK